MALLQYEAQLSERQRDIDLKDIKIESLESILRKRDQVSQEHASHVIAAIEEKVRNLESDREKLITDNVSLIKQIDRAREESNEIRRAYDQAKKEFEDRLSRVTH